MKTAFFITMVTTGCAGILSASETPQPFDSGRYLDTIATSPFVLETPKAAPEKVEENHFSGLFVSMISDVDGKPYVLVNRVGTNDKLHLTLGEAGEDGYKVTSINMGTSFKDTKVEITKNGKTGKIEFNQTPGASAVVPNPAVRQVMSRPPIPGSVSVPQPANAPDRIGRSVPRQPLNNATPPNGVPPKQEGVRRRLRVINN